jgi:large subunit ribosomal protein L17
MRHKRVGRKLGVVTKHRKSMLRNMVTDFLRYDRIKTTDTRAKELRRLAEKVITLAKLGTLHARRKAAEIIRDRAVLKRLFDEIAPRYKDRLGGYTRIIKLGMRRGDNAPISMLELVEEELKPKGKKRSKATSEKQEKPVVSEAKSRKKEAAEELGLIEGEKKGPEKTEPSSQTENKA